MVTPLTIIAEMRALPGKEEVLGAEIRALIQPTKHEKGCLMFNLYRSTNDKSTYVLLEQWEDQAALGAHFQTPHIKDYLSRKKNFMDGEISLQSLTPV